MRRALRAVVPRRVLGDAPPVGALAAWPRAVPTPRAPRGDRPAAASALLGQRPLAALSAIVTLARWALGYVPHRNAGCSGLCARPGGILVAVRRKAGVVCAGVGIGPNVLHQVHLGGRRDLDFATAVGAPVWRLAGVDLHGGRREGQGDERRRPAVRQADARADRQRLELTVDESAFTSHRHPPALRVLSVKSERLERHEPTRW